MDGLANCSDVARKARSGARASVPFAALAVSVALCYHVHVYSSDQTSSHFVSYSNYYIFLSSTVLLSTIMNKTHLNCCGKHISSVSPRTRQKRQRCTKICVITLYVTAFALTILLILHIAQAIYCLEVGQLFSNGNNVEEAAVMREEEVEEIEINSLMDGEGATFCSYRINTAYLSSILILDVFLWGYILLLMSRARAAIREHHYIYGGPLEDCCVSCCCNCCTLTQLAKETSYEDHETRRLSNVDVAIGEPGEFLSESGREGQHCYRPIV